VPIACLCLLSSDLSGDLSGSTGQARDGYRYIAAELSPWAANQLEFAPADGQVKLVSLWSKQEALFVHSLSAGPAVLWGCDIEEIEFIEFLAGRGS
jgi:hypothetical protein